MNIKDHESGLDRSRLPEALRERIMQALQRGDDTYDDVLDAIEAHWPRPESIEWRILSDGGHGPEVSEEPVNENAARHELARYGSERDQGATLQRRDVGAWEDVT